MRNLLAFMYPFAVPEAEYLEYLFIALSLNNTQHQCDPDSSNGRVSVLEAVYSRDVMGLQPAGPVIDHVLKPLQFSAQVGTAASKSRLQC
jgi:hypothetical protein